MVHFFNKVVKLKCKTLFSKLRKLYSLYISNKAFKISRSSDIYTSKKIKDFLVYDGVISANKQAFKMHIPPLLVFLREINESYIF